jgi:hypothetical protein
LANLKKAGKGNPSRAQAILRFQKRRAICCGLLSLG